MVNITKCDNCDGVGIMAWAIYDDNDKDDNGEYKSPQLLKIKKTEMEIEKATKAPHDGKEIRGCDNKGVECNLRYHFCYNCNGSGEQPISDNMRYTILVNLYNRLGSIEKLLSDKPR